MAPIVTSRIEREIKEVLLGAVHKLRRLKVGVVFSIEYIGSLYTLLFYQIEP